MKIAHSTLNGRKVTYINKQWIYDDNKEVADVFDKPVAEHEVDNTDTYREAI